MRLETLVSVLNIHRPDWQTLAACHGLPLDLFFPSSGMQSLRNINVIKPFCQMCPVHVQCLAYALSHPDERGIWAGTTENDRRKIRSKNFQATALVYSDGKYRQVKGPT
jgi:WhiB family redox-sensing transcriptional regulator